MPNLLNVYLSFDLDGNIDDTTTRVTTFNVEPEEDICEDVVPLADFIRGYGSSTSGLQSLHIRAADFFLDALYHLLRELHSLVEPTLEWVSMIHDTPDFLSLMQHQPPCLPRLQVLTFINYRGPDGFKIPHLRSFSESRGIRLTFSSYDVFENASRTDIQ
ncbi:hypothetical protein FA13DRAFT_1784788 [Coprinellus micaceus]|uniref:F-box domain-containing protein n=1 Tax=Coprinellus micaceus TaxID=71717 RepID=A0A4Y7U324_COPMI|nr:hypothetical protein FA13DRAFT_1784788 [Coprinellus micaceus]